MKIGLMTILGLFISVQVFAQEMVWTKTMGGTSSDVGYSITVDVNGNIYTTGSFGGTVDFDPGTGVFNLTSAGNDDIYIQKLDANGNFLWCQAIGGIDLDEGTDIAIDGNGDIYTTGSFEGTIDFDAGAGVFNLTSISDDDAYIQKIDANGNFIWAKRIGGAGYIGSTSLAIDANNNIYTTAPFRGIIDLDPGPVTFDFGSLWWDFFIQKLDVDGNFVWAKRIGGPDSDGSTDIAIDDDNNIYVVGDFEGTADFDPGSGVFNLTSVGVSANDAFILKLDANSNFIWAKDLGGLTSNTTYAYANSVAIDIDGNAYTTGYFTSTVDFNPGTGVFNLTARGTRDMFVQKLDVNGNFVWARRIGQPGTLWLGATEGENIVLDGNANIYLTGSFSQTTDFDPGLGFLNLTSVTYNDGFIQKLDVNGNLVWAKQIGGVNGDVGYDIAVDDNENVYALGLFRQTVDFDLGPGSFNVTSNGGADIYLLKLEQCGSNQVDVVSSCGAHTWIDGNTYTSNTITGTHTLTNAAGCDSIVSLDLTIQTINSVVFLLGNSLRTTNLSATYQWIDCSNNSAIAGATNSVFTPTANGSYALVFTENNCTDTSNCISVVVSGTTDLNVSSSIKVYPNPMTDYLTLEWEKSSKEILIQVLDLNGKVVLTQNHQTKNKVEILVKDLAAGVYFIKIRTEENLRIVKIIKD